MKYKKLITFGMNYGNRQAFRLELPRPSHSRHLLATMLNNRAWPDRLLLCSIHSYGTEKRKNYYYNYYCHTDIEWKK